MLRLLADENFHRPYIGAARRSSPSLEFVRVQDAGLRTVSDDAILEWAAANGYVVVSHDYRTMGDVARSRVARALPMLGVFLMPGFPAGRAAIPELVLLAEQSERGEWRGEVTYLG